MSRARDIASGINTRDDSGEAVPHIIPGVLYPSYVASGTANKLLDGITDHSGAFGTEQSDKRKYYYTNIAGSKPIKDPRIGGHFGSQRHKFKSLQLLEQETATQGNNVYSVDGREWIRAVGDIEIQNSTNGLIFNINDTTTFFEITGYFNQFNWLEYLSQSGSARNRWILSVDGTATTTESSNQVSVDSPLGGRYVDGVSVRNINTGLTTPRIVTIKMTTNSAANNAWASGCELIAHDTSNVNEIKIPKQNVVSYGKKFEVGSDTMGDAIHPHYDPFNGFVNGTSLHSAFVDTATSLGLDTAPGSSAKWAISSTNNVRPYNGGRVVKWVDSSGVIKTSVNMMPPNAQNILSSVAGTTEVTTPSATNTTPTPIFSDDAIDHTQAEVAKTFNVREFGNGSANGNANYPDASTLNTSASIAYVMDDGLTSLSGDDVEKKEWNVPERSYAIGMASADGTDYIYITFIGTGITVDTEPYGTAGGRATIAQNLPYGSHILKIVREGANSGHDPDYTIDGVAINDVNLDTYGAFSEVTFHQPKRPPIPEDACVIADYMLMADFVPQTNGDLPHISKGVRYCSASRDSFIDGNSATSTKFFQNVAFGTGGFQISLNQNGYTLSEGRIVGFGHSFGVNFMRDTDRMTNVQARLDGSNYTYASSDIWDTDTIWDDTNDDGTLTKSGSTAQEVYGIKNQTLGLHTFGDKTTTNPSANKFNDWIGWQIATPIHTSSHYQTFESPFLHELIGGDRNMEQTNLVCSPDGKTWDSLTRNTSYLGNIRFHASEDGQNADPIILTDFRGVHRTNGNHYQKNFAIAYDRFICLKPGQYEIKFTTYNNTTTTHSIKINGTAIQSTAMGNTSYTVANATTADAVVSLNRGDYVQISGKWYNQEMSHFSITEV